MPKIILYQFEECPYCARVRAKLNELGMEYEKINVPRDRESPIRRMIAEKSGIMTVPVIEIDGKFTGESAVIIEKLGRLK